MVRPLVSMAKGLLQLRQLRGGVAVLGLGLSGCLLPPAVEVPALPDARNRPPRIEERNVTPGRIIHLSPLDGCSQVFSLRVSDPDVKDVIRVRWFVDFDPEPDPRKPEPRFRESRLPPSDQELRDVSAQLTLRTDTPASEISIPGVHLVEAYVSDGEMQLVLENDVLVVKPLPRDIFPDGGVADPNYVVSYAWFVITPQGCPLAGEPSP
jgi:hypothetical protein